MPNSWVASWEIMMPRLRNQDEFTESMNIFQAFTDLMSNAFMIVTFLLFISFLLVTLRSEKTNKLQSDLDNKKATINKLEIELNKKNNIIRGLTSSISKLAVNPIIEDEKSKSFQFESGSAKISSSFYNRIQQVIIPRIIEIKRSNEQQIEFIQVIGHTDSQAIRDQSNLDSNLLKVVNNKLNFTALTPGSNIDLGLMRALAVVRQFENSPMLKKINLKFRAYSAGQLYDKVTNGYSNDSQEQDNKQRRIEIRFVPPADKTDPSLSR